MTEYTDMDALKLLVLRQTLFGQTVEAALAETKQDLAVLYMSGHPGLQELLEGIPHQGELPTQLEFLAGLLDVELDEAAALLERLPDPLRACLSRSFDRVFVTPPLLPLEESLRDGDVLAALGYAFDLGKVRGFKYALWLEIRTVQNGEENTCAE